jgi:hypothetical protein
MENLGLAEVAGRLFQQFGERAPSYRQLVDLVSSGRTPARRVGHRWMIREADIERVAVAFGLRPRRVPLAAALAPRRISST